MGWNDVGWINLAQDRGIMGFESGNERSDFIKFREFLGHVRKCRPFKGDVGISRKRIQKAVVLTGWFELAKVR
jgi:hypothetical protein